jgi:hypothetical protein
LVHLLTFDKKKNDHISTNKDKLLDDVIELRMGDKLTEETNNIIQKFITRMNTNEDPLKKQKKEEIKLLFYNNRDKIKDIIKKILAELNQ